MTDDTAGVPGRGRQDDTAGVPGRGRQTSTVVLASNNAKKLAELQRILAPLVPGIEVLGLADVADYPEPAETEPTFEGNALIKARACLEATGLPSLADDSGLCVDAINGMTGVLSARWSGVQNATAATKMALRRSGGTSESCDRRRRLLAASPPSDLGTPDHRADSTPGMPFSASTHRPESSASDGSPVAARHARALIRALPSNVGSVSAGSG